MRSTSHNSVSTSDNPHSASTQITTSPHYYKSTTSHYQLLELLSHSTRSLPSVQLAGDYSDLFSVSSRHHPILSIQSTSRWRLKLPTSSPGRLNQMSCLRALSKKCLQISLEPLMSSSDPTLRRLQQRTISIAPTQRKTSSISLSLRIHSSHVVSCTISILSLPAASAEQCPILTSMI